MTGVMMRKLLCPRMLKVFQWSWASPNKARLLINSSRAVNPHLIRTLRNLNWWRNHQMSGEIFLPVSKTRCTCPLCQELQQSVPRKSRKKNLPLEFKKNLAKIAKANLNWWRRHQMNGMILQLQYETNYSWLAWNSLWPKTKVLKESNFRNINPHQLLQRSKPKRSSSRIWLNQQTIGMILQMRLLSLRKNLQYNSLDPKSNILNRSLKINQFLRSCLFRISTKSNLIW